MTPLIRPAADADEPAIRTLVHGERLNPYSIHWSSFLVAEARGRVVGAVQMRHHRDGAQELGSLVVGAEQRKLGLAATLIDTVLAQTPGDIYMVTGRAYADHYARWGFHQIEAREAPAAVRRNYRLGHFGGCVMSRLQRRPFNRLVILRRFAAVGTWGQLAAGWREAS